MAKQKQNNHNELYPSYKGGHTILDNNGYVLEYLPSHPCSCHGYVIQHRLVYENYLGRYLAPHELIHHINENKTDNRIENLQLMSVGEHTRHHCISKIPDDIVLIAAKNHTRKEIASALGISVATLRKRYSHLLPQLNRRKFVISQKIVDSVMHAATIKTLSYHEFDVLNDFPHGSTQRVCQKYGITWEYAPRDITEDSVKAALSGRTTLEASKILGVHHQTLRNNYGNLLTKRKSPVVISPEVDALIRDAARNPLVGYREFAESSGICFDFVKKYCAKNDIQWVKKSRRGEKHRTYQGKITNQKE